MMYSLLISAFLSSLAAATPLHSRAQTLIPKNVFESTVTFQQYFTYNYPWGGTDHNGGARMNPSYVTISNNTLTITAQPVSGQKPATHAGKQIAIHYLSGAVGAKQHFSVPSGGGLVFSASFQATTTKGTWPAFWLTAVNGWPPEIDMAEWKGSGKISFNTFNTSSQVAAKDVNYPAPERFHDIRTELRDVNGKDVQIKFYMDGGLVTTQVGKGFTGVPMYL
jgi:galactan endo-beta-1,3-galactanase